MPGILPDDRLQLQRQTCRQKDGSHFSGKQKPRRARSFLIPAGRLEFRVLYVVEAERPAAVGVPERYVGTNIESFHRVESHVPPCIIFCEFVDETG